MRLFDDDPIDLPPVQVTDLRDDDEGQALWNQLQDLESRRQEAEATVHRESQPLADLMAEADELAARVLVGEADEEKAEAAEDEVQAARKRVEEARRTVQQCTRAEKLLREKLRARAADLHDENADVVRAVHRVLLHRALEAEKRAATLLRVLRTFEQQYARYTEDDDHTQYPQYLGKNVRTMPPRALLGAARTPDGTVFDRTEAAEWMRCAAERLDVEPPAVLDVASLDFETEETVPEFIDPEDIAAQEKASDEPDAVAAEPEDATDDEAPVDSDEDAAEERAEEETLADEASDEASDQDAEEEVSPPGGDEASESEDADEHPSASDGPEHETGADSEEEDRPGQESSDG